MLGVLQENHAWRGTEAAVQVGLGTELQTCGVVRAHGRVHDAKQQRPTPQRFMSYLLSVSTHLGPALCHCPSRARIMLLSFSGTFLESWQ